MDSSVVTMMHGVRGFFRFAHIDGRIASNPAQYVRRPKVQRRRIAPVGTSPVATALSHLLCSAAASTKPGSPASGLGSIPQR